MDSGKYVLFLFQSILWTLVAGEDACRCSKHILCLHPGCSPGPKCQEYIESGFSLEEKMAILNATNSFRSRIAMGKESSGNPGPQPSAADMMEVTWDDYLGLTSQRWADQCTLHGSDKSCRITGGCLGRENEYFGENTARYYHISFFHGNELNYHERVFLELIKRWENEVNYFHRYNVDHFVWGWLGGYENYLQLANGKTYAIGCGRTRVKYETYFVCHYKPGIQEFVPLYTRGEPGSKCPKGSIASKYEGLCAFDRVSANGIVHHHSHDHTGVGYVQEPVNDNRVSANGIVHHHSHDHTGVEYEKEPVDNKQCSGVSKNSHSEILIPSLFALVFMANKIQQFTAIAHY